MPITYSQSLRDTRGFTDALGRGMDKEIIDTVAVLRVLGIHSFMSCTGHARRHTGGPYVSFESPKARKYQDELYALEPDFRDVRYRRLHSTVSRLQWQEMQKLIPQLDAFYAHRATSYAHRLTISSIGTFGGSLYCQGAELSWTLSPADRKELLVRNRQEMTEFTEFLKEHNGIK